MQSALTKAAALSRTSSSAPVSALATVRCQSTAPATAAKKDAAEKKMRKPAVHSKSFVQVRAVMSILKAPFKYDFFIASEPKKNHKPLPLT